MFQTILVNPLFNILALLYAVVPGHDFGVAVILLTVLIRLILWPLVNKQLHSQRALQELQPAMAEVRKKAKGDKQKETQLIMELYKEREVSPFAAILPALLQLPIFIALYVVLRDFVHPGDISQLTYSFLRHLSGIKDVIAGGNFQPALFGYNLTKPSLVLALTAGIAQFFATKQLMPKDPAHAQPGGNVTLVLFPLITFSIGLRLPGALALYWTVTSAVAIFQQYLALRSDVTDLEATKKTKGAKA